MRCAPPARSRAYYLALLRGGPIAIPPVFVERIVAAIVAHLLAADGDPFERRAGQLLFRQQRIALHDGRVLSADLEAVDRRGPRPALDILRLADGDGADDDFAGLPVLGDGQRAPVRQRRRSRSPSSST